MAQKCSELNLKLHTHLGLQGCLWDTRITKSLGLWPVTGRDVTWYIFSSSFTACRTSQVLQIHLTHTHTHTHADADYMEQHLLRKTQYKHIFHSNIKPMVFIFRQQGSERNAEWKTEVFCNTSSDTTSLTHKIVKKCCKVLEQCLKSLSFAYCQFLFGMALACLSKHLLNDQTLFIWQP